MRTAETLGAQAMDGQKVMRINHRVPPPVPIAVLKDGKATKTHLFKPEL